MTASNQATAEQPSSSVPPAAKPVPSAPVLVALESFKPTPLDRFLGFFVGANFSNHYTRKDVRDINIYAPWTWVSVGMAATGIGLALERYAGIPFVVTMFPAAAAYTCMDRTIVRAESIGKADRQYDKMVHVYDPAEKFDARVTTSAFQSLQKRLKHMGPLSFRLGMAFCTSVITGGIIMEQIARNEINGMVDASYQADNAGLIKKLALQKADYDKHTADLQKTIDDLSTGAVAQTPKNVIVIAKTPADQARLDTANGLIASLNAEIGKTQKQLISDQNLMAAENNGAALEGASGQAGKKRLWLAAQIKVDGDQRELTELKAQLRAEQAILDKIATKDQETLALAQGAANTKRQDVLTRARTEIAQQKQDRTKTFDSYDYAFKHDPIYKPRDNETGIFADMHHLEEYLGNPKTGAIAAGFMRTVEILVFLAEMSAVLGALGRKPTPSEMIDARKRAGVIGQIEREVIAELDEVIPMRKRLQAMANTTWDKMHAFYRPDKASKDAQAQQNPAAPQKPLSASGAQDPQSPQGPNS